MTHRIGQELQRYGLALLAVVAAVIVRRLLDPWLGANVPYLLFFPAILVASWRGGLGPGILATGVSAAIAVYFYLPHTGFGVENVDNGVSLALFLATGVAIAWVSERRHGAERAAYKSASLASARAERLDAIINTTVDGIIVIDAAGLIESFNAGAERLFGYGASEVIGRNVSILMPSPHHEDHDGYLRRYQETGMAQIIGAGRQVNGRRRDGTTFPLHLSVGEMYIDGQRKFTGMLHDLTARVGLEEQLRASEARWRAIIDSAVDGIIVIDAQGRVEAFNPAAERLFGYAEAEVCGRNVDMLMPSPYREEHDHYLSRYLATGKAKIIGIGREVTGLRKDGTTFPLHLSVGQITIEGEPRFTGIVHDLTARVQIEARLRDQSALAHLGEMAAVLAHEIKNPLAGIRAAVEIVGNDLPDGHADADLIEDAKGRIDALDRLLRELLLFARPPQPRQVSVDLAPLVATSVRMFRTDPALKNVEVDVHGTAPIVTADPQMLELVFHNVLLNGAHAMNGQGRISVDVAAMGSAGQVTFTDRGPGIAADLREKVFAPFFTTKTHGSGLGLATAKRFIEAQHGQIWVEGGVECGASFVIRLPGAQ